MVFDEQLARRQDQRRVAAIASMMLGCVAVVVFVVGAESSAGPTELAVDCSADPWSHSCHPESMMDMINNVGHRARSNAIAQHKLKMQLLAEQKVTIEKKEEKHNAKEAAKKDVSGKNLKKAVYQGVDITSRTAVDKDLKKTLKRGGRAAVEKQVDQLREEILADAGKLTSYGKKAGYLPPPPGVSKKAAEVKLALKKAASVKIDPALTKEHP